MKPLCTTQVDLTMAPNPKTLKTQSPLSPSQFSFTITKVAVSQICQSVGFRGSKTSALETLTRIATIYLQTLAKAAASHAANSNRTDSNLFDVIRALEELASVYGFSGASNVHKSLLRSSTVLDIMTFVDRIDEIPFAMPIPRFNSSSRRPILPRNNKFQSSPSPSPPQSHIPRWLPPFPDPRTYQMQKSNYSDIEVNNRIPDEFSEKENDADGTRKCERIEREKCELELPGKRGRVRFKFGVEREVNLRNGVCKSGKRICWSTNKNNEELTKILN